MCRSKGPLTIAGNLLPFQTDQPSLGKEIVLSLIKLSYHLNYHHRFRNAIHDRDIHSSFPEVVPCLPVIPTSTPNSRRSLPICLIPSRYTSLGYLIPSQKASSAEGKLAGVMHARRLLHTSVARVDCCGFVGRPSRRRGRQARQIGYVCVGCVDGWMGRPAGGSVITFVFVRFIRGRCSSRL